ncbi:helix-turn-helix transcriptional regulator [Kitasatospora sp. NBC_01287]|uniref:helix-turn-helix domain-containing protein n=1 Tax=Kitasatospora sp. NBC_01287 TaxID=2903573 RepID=UPI00224E3215|nr:helix-turn-helix transcriptional regulator [Kitasatospora sp. NBC_01287]MCX4751750.1 helix-turn-helix transcriptional regulator [Kitasatospora sp. NBC_01287]MCX4751958.1 helix-turn-helix transcriptional regulator [Kitasatospora sp. NBC_01287]
MTPIRPGPVPEELHARPLSRREVQVLALAAQGCTNLAIADDLGIAFESVRTYLRTAYLKLGARDRAHAVHLAHDLITAQEQQR